MIVLQITLWVCFGHHLDYDFRPLVLWTSTSLSPFPSFVSLAAWNHSDPYWRFRWNMEILRQGCWRVNYQNGRCVHLGCDEACSQIPDVRTNHLSVATVWTIHTSAFEKNVASVGMVSCTVFDRWEYTARSGQTSKWKNRSMISMFSVRAGNGYASLKKKL